ncbi:Hpt domain-containing protein [Maricaulis sp.]|uniref:Hpt domain-containing protein n=1 Tax=unclassified Maricaulis TaxID=2632371 RepID=UPI001B13F260|nr:Hpt domain-containing protein [Maricaulis sp.]MBO6795551.1 Hpt domain-containing protein [Maricaulis sp.]
MSDWRNAPEMDPEVINTLIAAVGKEAFSAMKQQFIDDLRSLYGAYSEAHGNQDSEAARQTAHALKGAAVNIGLKQLGALAAALEAGDASQADELGAVFAAAVDHLEAAA